MDEMQDVINVIPGGRSYLRLGYGTAVSCSFVGVCSCLPVGFYLAKGFLPG